MSLWLCKDLLYLTVCSVYGYMVNNLSIVKRVIKKGQTWNIYVTLNLFAVVVLLKMIVTTVKNLKKYVYNKNIIIPVVKQSRELIFWLWGRNDSGNYIVYFLFHFISHL